MRLPPTDPDPVAELSTIVGQGVPSGQLWVAAQGITAAPLTLVQRKVNHMPLVALLRLSSSKVSTMKQDPATGVAVKGTGVAAVGPTPQPLAAKPVIQVKTGFP